MGFFTGHNAITIEFEQVLQLVDPTVTVPYWDYTIDMHAVREQDKDFRAFYDSGLFADDWFGPMGKESDGFVVTGGETTAYLSVDPVFWGIPAEELKITNAYGLLRSPWNTAPAPFLMRSNKTFGFETTYMSSPRCAEFYNAMQYTDVKDFQNFASQNCHGSIHTMIGGAANSNWKQWANNHEWMPFYAEAAGLQGFGVHKRMWRTGEHHISCPSTCSADAKPNECACSCPNLHLDSMTDEEVRELLHAAVSPDFQLETTSGKWIGREFVKLMCGYWPEYAAPHIGDALNSGATADPSFWPVHPNIDRLFQWRKLQGVTGTEHWPDGADFHTGFYWGGGNGETCWGHNPSDVMIWSNLFLDDRLNSQPYTVRQLFHFMDPASGNLPYVYDNFVWEHCEAEGYPTGFIGDRDSDAENDEASSWQESSSSHGEPPQDSLAEGEAAHRRAV